MPQVVGLLILEAAAALTAGAFDAAAVGATALIGGITVSAAIGTAVLAASSVGLSLALASNPSIPKPAAGHASIRQPIPSRVWLCGRARLGGKYMLYEQTGNISFDVVAFCQGPVSRFVQLYLHDDAVTILGTPLPNFTIVTGCPRNQDGRYVGVNRNLITVNARVGLATETAFATTISVPAFATIWTSAHRGDGIASLELICAPSASDRFQAAYPQALPVASYVIDGPPIWDLRTTQDPGNPTTWTPSSAWSDSTSYALGSRVNYLGVEFISAVSANLSHVPDANDGHWVSVFANPVLRMVDYLINPDHGMGLDRATLIDPVKAALIIEANHCDELVLRTDGDFEPRYACNGFYNYDTDPQEIITAILSACDGWMTENADGTLALVVGVYRDEGALLKDRHIVGMSVDHGQADEAITNELHVSFTSRAHDYRQIDAQPWRYEADISARGVTRSETLALTWVQSHAQARRLAKRAMTRIQAPMRGTCVVTLYGLTILGKRWVHLQYSLIAGLSDCWVEIQQTETDFQTGRVTFDWIMVDPVTLDAWDPATEEGKEPPLPLDVAASIAPVPNFVRAILVGDATTGVHFEINFPDPNIPGLAYVVRYRLLIDPATGLPGPWIELTTVSFVTDGTTVHLSTPNVQANQDYIVEVASAGVLGSRSDWSDPVTVSSIATAILDESSGTVADETGQSILSG